MRFFLLFSDLKRLDRTTSVESASIYIKESGVSYTIYNSRTDEPIWLKIGGEVA